MIMSNKNSCFEYSHSLEIEYFMIMKYQSIGHLKHFVLMIWKKQQQMYVVNISLTITYYLA